MTRVAFLGLVVVLGASSFAIGAPLPLPVPAFDAPARAVGTYQVISAKKDGKQLCDRGNKTQAPDAFCGKYVWAIRGENQLALLSPKNSPGDHGSIESVFFRDGVVHRGCTQKIAYENALKGGVFKGRFCRSFYSDSNSGSNFDLFDFSHGTPEMSSFPESTNAVEAAISVGLFSTALTTIPEIFFSVSLPKNEVSPKSFTVTKTVGTLFLLIPILVDTDYELTYVSN